MLSLLVDTAVSYLGARRVGRLGTTIDTIMGKNSNRRKRKAVANRLKQITKLVRKNKKNYAFLQCSSIEELERVNSKDR